MRGRGAVLLLAVAVLCLGGMAISVAWSHYPAAVTTHTGPSRCVPGGIILRSGTVATHHGKPVLRVLPGHSITVRLEAQPPPAYSLGQGEVLSDVTVELQRPRPYDPVHQTGPSPAPHVLAEVSTPQFHHEVDLGRGWRPGRYRVFVTYSVRFTTGACAVPGSGGGSRIVGYVVVR